MDWERYKDHFNRHNLFLGWINAKLTVAREDYAEVEMVTDERHKNSASIVHGGAIYTLADTAAGAMVRTRGKNYVTLEGKLNYLHAGSIEGSCLKAVARPLHMGRHTGVVECRVVDEKETLIAVGVFTMYILDSDVVLD
ncbi:MAG: PaaI family thioesterase [Clostridiales bacterium]|nr:PaaI family thioesterase [Clostridiales bacterium]